MNTTETLPFPFHTQAWSGTHYPDGSFVGEEIAVGIIAQLLEEVATLTAKLESLEN